ncbi:Type IV secretory pathway, VirD4 component, TraG/TraD family ATPase [Actinopolyspora alba]|uniref:Type IV secretory pathway, VirD4 component, TraG/TraD family ATPase n=1 Tax=Actinopolyspora alba TaxID=673379 RepID=A0A1I1YR60_9ACTN|nr:TraM recognition domain-containing protein [Actinopolyspora alba]SFE22007.1 Type IV secretory pathway, VirD4 component, TraG/TraD family ATPase [Actinopolyspora alba]
MSTHRRLSPATDRDLALMGLLVAVLGTLLALAAALMTGAAVATTLTGGPWAVPGFDTWVHGTLDVLTHPTEPTAGLGAPWETALADRADLYWIVTVTILATGTAAITTGIVVAWRRFGPSTPGHASREDIRRELSPEAARRTARWTRPGLSPRERRRAPLEELAVPLHRGPNRQRLCVPLENPTGAFAPTQSGKSRTDLVHKALSAPGALLCSTTKPDLVEFAALARTRREQAGPVLVFDTTGEVSWPARVRYSPITGCTEFTVARRRAETLVDAAAVGLENIGGNDKVFRERAKTVVQSYLIAAAHDGRSVGDLVTWAITKPPDQEPVELLRHYGFPELADNLRAEIGMVAETSDAVWLSVRRVIEPWLDPQLRQLCTPEPGQEFDVGSFIDNHGSLFLIAGEHQAAQVRPILTALVEDILTTEQDMALSYPHRRLDPPATNVLDELFDATPIPRLPEILADSAGRGVRIDWAAQSLAHLEILYEETGRRQLLDNTTTLTLWGGIKDPQTLEWVSTLTGHHERRRYQQQSDGLLGTSRTSIGTETVPTYRPGAVRTLDRGRVLVFHRHLDPILAQTVDVTRRRDWTQLRADVETIRRGQPPVSLGGYPLPTAPQPGNTPTVAEEDGKP